MCVCVCVRARAHASARGDGGEVGRVMCVFSGGVCVCV